MKSYVRRDEQRRANAEGETPKKSFYLTEYTVFNIEQCEKLPEKYQVKPEIRCTVNLHEEAEKLITATGARIQFGGNRAAFSPNLNIIMMPSRDQFPDTLDFYRTQFHELTHWTGHKSRLDRKFTEYGTEDYAREELVAEIGTAFVSTFLGIAPTLQHASYIENWLKILKQDKKEIFRAAREATKAANFLLAFIGVKHEDSSMSDGTEEVPEQAEDVQQAA